MVWTDFSYSTPPSLEKSSKLDPGRIFLHRADIISMGSIRNIVLIIFMRRSTLPLETLIVRFWWNRSVWARSGLSFDNSFGELESGLLYNIWIRKTPLRSVLLAPGSLALPTRYQSTLFNFTHFVFFWILILRIYTLYVIFTSYDLYPWKSSSRSPIKIFSP